MRSGFFRLWIVTSALWPILFAPSITKAADNVITLQCTETLYDKTGNNPYDVPQYFVLKSGIQGSSLRWDNNRDVELHVVKETTTLLEADGKTKEYMPVPQQIDKCIATEIATKPGVRNADGTINFFTVLDCVWGSDHSDREVPVSVQIKIDRMTGSLTITRRQDDNPNHDTQHLGACKTVKPQF